MNEAPPLFGDPRLQAQITHMEELPPRAAIYAEPKRSMHPSLRAKLDDLGIRRLYTHQALAYDAVADGKDVVVVTGTNSGKTM